MTTLSCANHLLAIGLQWAFVEDKSEVRTQLKQAADAKHYVVASSEEGMLLGMQSASKADKKAKGTQYAGGLLVGKLLPDAILYEQTADDRIWVCAVRGGLPLPGMDKVTEAGEALQVVADVRAYAQTPVTLVGSHPEASMTLEALLQQVEPSMLPACKMRKASDSERSKFYGVLAMAFCLLAWAVWEFMPQREVLDEDFDEVVHAGEPRDEDTGARDAKLIAEARSKFLRRADMALMTAVWGDVINRLPYAVGGYRPAISECRNNQCMLQWNWRAPRFERKYLDQLPGERLPSKAPGEYVRQVQTRIPLRGVTATRELNGVAAHEMDDWAIGLMTQVTRAGGRVEILPANQAVNVSLPPQGGRGQSRSKLIGHEGRVNVMATGWGHIQSVFAVLAQQDLVPERAVFNINGSNIGLQMEARYVVPSN